MPTLNNNQEIKLKVKTQQLKALYQYLPSTVTSIMGALLLSFIFWDFHKHSILLSWLVTILITNNIFTFILYIYFKKNFHNSHENSHEINKWQYLILIVLLCIGISWGVLPLLFYNGPIEHQLLIIGWLWALAAIMPAIMVSHRTAVYLIVIPLLLPLVVTLASQGDTFQSALSFTTFIWMIFVIIFHYKNYKTMEEAINLRFTNEELAEQLAKKNTIVKQANNAKSKFLAAASHDLRQPLHAQSLFVAELDNYIDDPQARKILGGLENSIFSMKKLLDSILDISKLEAGTITPCITSISLQAIYNDISTALIMTAQDKNIDLKFRPCHLSIYSDPVLLKSILQNLICNAIKYTDEGAVLVGCRRKGKFLRLDIIDTGIGIAKHQQDEIFQPFSQIGNQERNRDKGLGLGLTITQHLAKLLAHPISLSSCLNKGSRFSINIPISDKKTLTCDVLKPNKKSIFDFTGKSILVIDDDESILSSSEKLLLRWGFNVSTASSLAQAEAMIQHGLGSLDILITDYRLENNVTGIEVIEKLNKLLNKTLPSIIITGDTSVDSLMEVQSSGHPILNKPVLAEDLKTLLQTLI